MVFPDEPSHTPIREWIGQSRTTLFDQVRHSRAPPHQAFQQVLQTVFVALQPSRWDTFYGLIYHFFRKTPDTAEPRLEFGEATHRPVDQGSEI
jgi:hypothetical protein